MQTGSLTPKPGSFENEMEGKGEAKATSEVSVIAWKMMWAELKVISIAGALSLKVDEERTACG